MDDLYEYDVALSFAGEDREYVRGVADSLRSHNLRVFFDEYEQVDMWGKDLYEYLHEVYSSKAKYCVLFISEAYSRKVWTTHERRSAQERELHELSDYILPARFDDIELPGIRGTTAYINLRELSPSEFAKMIVEKLGQAKKGVDIDQEPQYRIPRPRPKEINPYDEAERFLSKLEGGLKERSISLRSADATISIFKRGERTCFRVVRTGRTLFSMDVWTGGFSGDQGISFYAIDGKIRGSSSSMNAWGDFVWDQEKEDVVLKLNDLSLFGHIPSQEQHLTYDEFAERIWERIVDVIDRDRI